MRTTPLVGSKLWFKPRKWGGWGWSPASSEGWAAVVLFLAATGLASTHVHTDEAAVLGLAGALLGVCVLKGTPPGGPGARAEFDRLTGGANRPLPRLEDPSVEGIVQRFDEHHERGSE